MYAQLPGPTECERTKLIVYCFVPFAVETLGVLGSEARAFLRDLACRLTSSTNDQQSHQFLLQRVAVTIQRGNAAAVLGTIGGMGNK